MSSIYTNRNYRQYSNQKSIHSYFKKQKLKNFLSLEKYIKAQLKKKYNFLPLDYEKQQITNIIFNEKSHLVSIFKDFLILDDDSEFLKRYYTKTENPPRLRKFLDYYATYSKIYPNYTPLPESKFFYINIQRKQKLIDLQEEMEYQEEQNKLNKRFRKDSSGKEEIQKIFETDVYDSIINDINSENIEILFNVNYKEFYKEENNFLNWSTRLIGEIEKYECLIMKNHFLNNLNNNLKNDPLTDRLNADRYEMEMHKMKNYEMTLFQKRKLAKCSSNGTCKSNASSLSTSKMKYSDLHKTRNSSNEETKPRKASSINNSKGKTPKSFNNTIQKKVIYGNINAKSSLNSKVTFYKHTNITQISQQGSQNTSQTKLNPNQMIYVNKNHSSAPSRSNPKKKRLNLSQEANLSTASVNRKDVKRISLINSISSTTNKNTVTRVTNVFTQLRKVAARKYNDIKTERMPQTIGYKEMHMLRVLSASNDKSKRNSSRKKENSSKKFSIANYTTNITKCQTKRENKNYNGSILSRNIIKNTHNNSNSINKSSSYKRKGKNKSINEDKRKNIQGIHIKNFSKIFNFNFPQANTDRGVGS